MPAQMLKMTDWNSESPEADGLPGFSPSVSHRRDAGRCVPLSDQTSR